MCRKFSEPAKIARRRHQRASEKKSPDSVDEDSRRERVA